MSETGAASQGSSIVAVMDEEDDESANLDALLAESNWPEECVTYV